MNQYLLLLHENPSDYATLSPAEMQEIIHAQHHLLSLAPHTNNA